MAVIKHKPLIYKQKEKSSLQALTAAALLLPGMLPVTAEAIEEAEFSFQYGHYEEGERKVSSTIKTLSGSTKKVDVPQTLKPIEVDSFLSSIKVALTDRIKFKANFSQDTWAGATPVASAPAIFGFNGTDAFVRNGVVTGASPFASTAPVPFLIFDKQLNPLKFNNDQVTGALSTNKDKDNEIAHTIAEASPETRKQGDFSLSYDWDNASVNFGGGISVERDYESRFYNFGGRLDFNQKLTSVDAGVSYTNSTTNALVDHHARAYFFNSRGLTDEVKAIAKKNGYRIKNDFEQGSVVIQGRRQDWGFNLGLTQIINKNALIKLSGSYTYSDGYMSNPYKGVSAFFITGPSAVLGPDVLEAQLLTYLEQRPLQRNQFKWNARLVQHIEALDASVHLGYQFTHDDWGINTHTFDADWVQSIGYGWSITPRIRYYSQSEADFYTPFLVIPQNKSLPNYFSSDHRLSGFGTLSGGVTIKKEFAKGVSFVAGFEYYTHQGQLKLGGGGEGSYADFDSYMVSGAINVNMAALGRGMGGARQHHVEHSAPLPAGVRLGHMLKQSNEFMVGYRYQYKHTQGDLLHGRSSAKDADIVAKGCKNDPCFVAPNEMTMQMHMIDLMYAPTDWLTLMLMPQFVDKSMTMSEVEGAPPHGSETGAALGIAISHTRHEHITGGLGDTGMYAMFKLFDDSLHHLHLSLGFTAPTGDSDIKLRGAHGFEMGFIHYGMQVGSGTWDFKPSLTYTGQFDKWNWGAQVSGTKRLGKNDSGFSFGDELEGTAWGGYRLTDWLNATVRGVYSTKGKLRGVYTADGVLANPSIHPDNVAHVKVGTMDYPGNYGGRYWDVGFGLNAFVSKGDFRGNTFSFEWLQPVVDDVNGYQREREGALTASWSYMF